MLSSSQFAEFLESNNKVTFPHSLLSSEMAKMQALGLGFLFLIASMDECAARGRRGSKFPGSRRQRSLVVPSDSPEQTSFSDIAAEFDATSRIQPSQNVVSPAARRRLKGGSSKGKKKSSKSRSASVDTTSTEAEVVSPVGTPDAEIILS